MAANAEAYAAGKHPGYEATAWQGLLQTIDVINQKRIKVAINGGALNPQGLAAKINAEVITLIAVCCHLGHAYKENRSKLEAWIFGLLTSRETIFSPKCCMPNHTTPLQLGRILTLRMYQ